MEDQLTAALIEEATKKSSLIWLTGPDSRAQAAWHVWLNGSVYVVSGGSEQRLPALEQALTSDSRVTVTVRSKDKGGRLVTFLARPSRVRPATSDWDEAAAALHAKRLNAPDGERQPARWARESMIIRLEPTGIVVERPGQMPADSQAAPPPQSPATTIGALPFMLGRKRRAKGAG